MTTIDGQPSAGAGATIVALASGRPPAAIAVIRISGPQAHAAVVALAGRLPPPRRAVLRRLRDPADGALLDEALVVVFEGPASATGEDAAELHLHGGIAVVAGVLAALTALPGLRLAEAGEFTRRAFANGRLDLTQVEGLADLVAAETTTQRSQALALAGGALARLADAWRDRCLDVLAEAEAAFDFAEDEADVAERLTPATTARLLAMASELAALIDDAARGARLRDGLTIVVSGPPNVGKSSLVNALSRREVAIVAALPGTTRDPIEVALDLDGVAVVLVDTAGLRESEDPVEAEGIRRARLRAASADLVLRVDDGLLVSPPVGSLSDCIPIIAVTTKADLGGVALDGTVHVSAVTGIGVIELRAKLAQWAREFVRPGEPALLSHARHREAFAKAYGALQASAAASDDLLRSEHLRQAAQAFGLVAGRVGVEDVLGRIFSRFCVGK